MNTILLAMIYDYFAGANEGHVRITDSFFEKDEDEEDTASFGSGEEFEERRRKILGGLKCLEQN